MSNRIIAAFTQFFDDSGKPLVNGKLKFYQTGTTTDKNTYANSSLSIPNTNPVILDGAGRCPDVFGSGIYKVVSFTSDNIQIQVFDPVSASSELAGQFDDWVSTQTYLISDVVRFDGSYYKSITNNNINNTPPSNPVNWEQLQFGRVWNSNITYSVGDSVYGSDGIMYVSKTLPNLNNNPVGDKINWTNNKTQVDIQIGTGLGISYICTGPANAYVLGLPAGRETLNALYAGFTVQFFGSASNTGASTLDVSPALGQVVGTTIMNIRLTDGTDLIQGDIKVTQLVQAVFNGTQFILINPLGDRTPVPVPRTWSVVTGSRSSGVTYTNTSGDDMMVTYNISSTSTSAVSAIVGGVVIYDQSVGGVQSLSFMVADGETYLISYDNVSSHTWAEWS